MNPLKLSLILLFFTFSFGTITSQNCSILKNNSFTYRAQKDDILVEFKENEFIEYHQDKKYFIKSSIEWVSDCEYYLTVKEATLPDFPFGKGTKLHIVVNKVKGSKVFYTSSMNGRTWQGKMKKIGKKS